MKSLFALVAIVWTPMAFAASEQAAPVPPCSKEQLLGYSPPQEEIAAHRQFVLPAIDYPFETKLSGLWGVYLTMRVDVSGRVACYGLKDEFDRQQPLNPRRQALIGELKSWRYAPLQRGPSAVAAIVSERIGEQEMPKEHLPLPEVPLANVHLALERSECFGACPSYRVDLYGDGRVVYQGKSNVDVEGTHAYRVPPASVEQLVASLRNKDIWSLRADYSASITDNPSVNLTIELGEQTHRLHDYVGEKAGMPSSVTEFENEVDNVARSDIWVNLAMPAVKFLEKERFEFRSRAGANLLARAVANEYSHDGEAMLRLIELGVPLDGSAGDRFSPDSPGALFDNALKHRRAILIEPLITRGALQTGGREDPSKIDAAFRAAITGGQLAIVRAVWNAPGDALHPSLMFDDPSAKGSSRKLPVTLLLSHAYRHDSWEGFEIAKWLVAQGCDIRAAAADGTTLLHIAAEANDAKFVRYLLEQGLDAKALGKYRLPPLGSTHDEETALLLLEAGDGLAGMEGADHGFVDYARSNHWDRVIAWLKAHGRD